MSKLAVCYKIDYSEKHPIHYDIDYLQLVSPGQSQRYFDETQYFKLKDLPAVLYCLLVKSKSSIMVLGLYTLLSDSISELHNRRHRNLYVSQLKLNDKGDQYRPERIYYRVHKRKLRFNGKIYCHSFFHQYQNVVECESRSKKKDITSSISFPDEPTGGLEERLRQYQVDLACHQAYRQLVMRQLIVVEDEQFASLIKNRYGDNAKKILAFLAKYPYHNTLPTEAMIDQEIKRLCPKKEKINYSSAPTEQKD